MKNRKLKYQIISANIGIGAQITETEFGPHAILDIMPDEKANSIDINIEQEYKILPLGYERLKPIVEFCNSIAASVEESINDQKFPIVIGGDHSVAVGTWSGVIGALDSAQNFGLIWIDAHLDSNTFETSPSKAYHGMPLAALLGYGQKELTDLRGIAPKLNPSNVVMVGIRSYEEKEHELLKSLGVKIFYISDIEKTSIDDVLKRAVEIASNGTNGFGVSLDLDVIDPSLAPGVGSREGGGVDALKFISSVKYFCTQNLKAFEIVEYNPDLDVGNKTAIIAKTIIQELIKHKFSS